MLQNAIRNTFVQLTSSLEQLTNDQYQQPCKTLFNASIGKHLRHIIELFQCLEDGYEKGIVNYEKRKRDPEIENNKALALELLKKIHQDLDRPDKALKLESTFDEHSNETILIDTNFQREVLYNLEHTIHHMALIRVGISEVAQITLPDSYGVAPSTTKYKQECAQ